jgi:hypothetical protein
MAKFAAQPLSLSAAQPKYCAAQHERAGARRERHMSLIEKREVQQLYDEIMRRPNPASRR